MPHRPARSRSLALSLPCLLESGLSKAVRFPTCLRRSRRSRTISRSGLTEDPEIKCYMPGVPRATYMPYPFQIEQSSRYLMIAYEFNNSIRTVHMDNPGPNPAGDSWMGWSVGHWEGDTLVVDVTGMNDQTWFDRAGDYHSDELHVTERYTPRSADVLNYEATIEDPQVFSRPWKISVPLYRHLEKNFQLMEYKCVPFAEEVLYGKYRRHGANAEK